MTKIVAAITSVKSVYDFESLYPITPRMRPITNELKTWDIPVISVATIATGFDHFSALAIAIRGSQWLGISA